MWKDSRGGKHARKAFPKAGRGRASAIWDGVVDLKATSKRAPAQI